MTNRINKQIYQSIKYKHLQQLIYIIAQISVVDFILSGIISRLLTNRLSNIQIRYPMKTVYPLKKADPSNIVEPLVKYLQQNDSPGAGVAMRDTLGQINQLRNKACALELPSNPSAQVIDKYIAIIEMYVRYARLIAKHFNWNSEYGPVVDNFNVTWCDSFNPQLKFSKNEIHLDIFCCFYNLGVLYFNKASLKCVEDFLNSKKQAIQFAKRSFYFFNQMRTVYYTGFVNTGFCDTNYPHLEMLECLSLGIIYKSMFDMFKEDEYKHGINKIASLAVLAQENFYKAYQIGVQFFMKSSNISNNIKSELLSFAYVESLYHDVIANSKYAKHYENQMDVSKDNIVLLLAYQKKALRLLNLGLTNESVVHLLDQRSEQKKDLLKIKPEIEAALNKNIMRNKEIYKKQQIAQQKMPPPFEPPKQYLVKASEPKEVAIQYQSKNAAPFAKLSDNQSKGFINELKELSKNRLNGLQSAYTKLQKNIETIYNDTYVNYYLNLQSNNKNKGIPENLKKKIQQIQMNGGKSKLDMEVNIIKKNAELSAKSFQNLRKLLLDEEAMDNQKRQQYGQQWRRPPSSVVQASYRNNIDSYESKAKQADQVNQKIITKYENLQKQIKLSDSSQAEIFNSLPKVQVTKFIQENKKDFDDLKQGTDAVKSQMQEINSIVNQLKSTLNKIDYNQVAQSYMKGPSEQSSKEALLEKLFGKSFKLTESFNEKAKTVQENAKKVGQISSNLNKKNKGDQANKKQFQVIMANYNDVNNLFRELVQGTSFYTKLNDILAKLDNDVEGLVTARKFQAQQLEQSFGKKGGSGGFGGPNLPNMYPNQQPPQNFGFYVPPPMNFNQNQSMGNPYQQGNQGNQGSLGDMLKNLMSSKPTFDTNLFGGGSNVYQSKYK